MTNEAKARSLADTVRRRAGLGDGPIIDLFEFAHAAAGVDVLSMDAAEEEHGLSMVDPGTGTVAIAVATTSNPMRQRTSIAHELGHVLAGDLEREVVLTPGERSPQEIRADAFARHLLLPLTAVRRRLGAREAVSAADLSELVQEFEVSPKVAAIQLKEAGQIDEGTYARWGGQSTSQLATRFGWLGHYKSLVEASSRPRAPQRLVTRAVEGYQAGVLSIAELALWYGQDARELQEQLGPPTTPQAPVDDWDEDAPLFPAPPAQRTS